MNNEKVGRTTVYHRLIFFSLSLRSDNIYIEQASFSAVNLELKQRLVASTSEVAEVDKLTYGLKRLTSE